MNYFEKCRHCKPPIRHPGCQDHCDNYKEAKARRDADLEKQKAGIQMKYYLNERSAAVKDGIAKYAHKRPRRHSFR